MEHETYQVRRRVESPGNDTHDEVTSASASARCRVAGTGRAVLAGVRDGGAARAPAPNRRERRVCPHLATRDRAGERCDAERSASCTTSSGAMEAARCGWREVDERPNVDILHGPDDDDGRR